jgi:hypothetical protein
MANINDHIDAFISCNSLNNARKLVNHVRRHPMVMCLLTEDHAGQVRNAERMVDTEASRVSAVNREIAKDPRISAGEARRIHALLKGRN